ncbi:MAG: SH3 domain-containing protein [Cyanobacteriota bacterium]|nr:SH3 domain-containing protein [Cyanobacteriota bacterium]
MKFNLPIAGVSLVALLTPTLVRAQPTAQEVLVCSGISALNLRETPGGRILESLPPGTPVLKVAPPAGDWQPIATEEYRGYVWGAYLCSEASEPEPEPDNNPEKPVVIRPTVTPARCGRNDADLRNVRSRGGLEIFAQPDSTSEILGFANNGGVIRLNGVSIVDAMGVIWQPINHPERGYIEGGRDGIVDNIVYCTRFYE